MPTLSISITVNGQHALLFSPVAASYSGGSAASFPNAATIVRHVVADFDSDGDADVLFQVGGTGSAFQYARNEGNATFTIVAQASSPFANLTLPDITALGLYRTADYDRDGDVDIWIPAASSNGTYFLQNGRPPSIISSNPPDNSANVPVNSNISVVFSEPVLKGTGNIRIVRSSDNTVIETIPVASAQVSGSGTNYAINPSSDLGVNTSYAVQFDAGTFRNAAGAIFFGINNNAALNFTTAATPTSASVRLSGRISNEHNRGAYNVTVTLINSSGEASTARTNMFGYYAFENLEIGTYVISIESKRHIFDQNIRIITLLTDADDIDFVAAASDSISAGKQR